MPDQNWHSSNSISADATTLPLPLQGKFESDFEDRLYLRIRAEPHHRRNPADHCWLAGSLRRLTLLHLKIPKNMKKASKRGGFKIHGGRRGIRTLDTRIFSPLLYQLSYPTSMYRRMFTTRIVIVLQTFFRSSNTQDLYGERKEAQLFLRELFYQSGHYFEHVAHNAVIGHVENGRMRVLVDRNDRIGMVHSCHMLYRT